MPGFLLRFAANPLFFRYLALATLSVTTALYFIISLEGILAPFLFATIGAYLLNKVARRLDPYMPRGASAGVLIAFMMTLLILLSATAIPYIQSEGIYIARELPKLTERLFQQLQALLLTKDQLIPVNPDTLIGTLRTQMSSYLGDIVQWSLKQTGNLLTNGILLANALSLAILTPIIMFYMLRDWPHLVDTVFKFNKRTFSDKINILLTKIDRMLTSYLAGQTIVCLVLSALYICALSLTGLDKAWLVGGLSGILSFIPYLGFMAGLITSLSIAFANFISWGQIIAIVSVYILISLVEGNVLTPKFVGKRIGLHPVIILFSILTAGSWFGFIGIIFAIPTAAIIRLIYIELHSYTVTNAQGSRAQ